MLSVAGELTIASATVPTLSSHFARRFHDSFAKLPVAFAGISYTYFEYTNRVDGHSLPKLPARDIEKTGVAFRRLDKTNCCCLATAG